MKIGFVSLGCPKNRCDTEVMLKELVDAGYEITPEETDADIIVINTCAFIESAKREAIDNILDIAWLKKNHSLKGIVVTGCLTERYREEILKEFPEVDAVLGVGSIHNIVEAVNEVAAGKRYSSFEDKNEVRLGGDRVLSTPEYTAYIKIAEGCNNRCTYCAIPYIRGKMRSRDMDSIIAEAKDLEAIGVKELCVVAQDTTAYGIDLYGRYALPELLQRLVDETGIEWIRILYCYPDKITDELIDVMKRNDRILNYIDMPLQHISDPILKKMNRKGDSACIRSVIKKLRENLPGVIIRTTFIVGFPGETQKDYNELLYFIKQTKFERAGVFAYSREEGTPAYDFTPKVPEQKKQNRADTLMDIQLDVSSLFLRSLLGKTVKVLCEEYDPVSEVHFGRSYADAPDIDGKVYFRSEKRVAPGTFVNVKIEEMLDYDVIGSVVEDNA
ncbi:MAG: 30S ribosomal protein S12 methylthiotransferase RimO [Ruminococcaceae bacterium]|nr:30S ribosomal protein S12 methylthiotransferase RimO [Oscillospiraceae bacterium]